MIDKNLLELLYKWVEEHDKTSFKLEYGYQVCEVPWLELHNEDKSVFSGTLQEFEKWTKP